VKTHPPSIPYLETITRAAEGHCRHKKQTGGAGQFGEVFLRVEALTRGAGFEFVDDVVGGAIPGQYIPAVEKGVRQVLTEGALAGFPGAASSGGRAASEYPHGGFRSGPGNPGFPGWRPHGWP